MGLELADPPAMLSLRAPPSVEGLDLGLQALEEALALGPIPLGLLGVAHQDEAARLAAVLERDLLDLEVLAHPLVAAGPGEGLLGLLRAAAQLLAHDHLPAAALEREALVLPRHAPVDDPDHPRELPAGQVPLDPIDERRV